MRAKKRWSILVPGDLDRAVELAVQSGYAVSKADLIRTAVRLLLAELRAESDQERR